MEPFDFNEEMLCALRILAEIRENVEHNQIVTADRRLAALSERFDRIRKIELEEKYPAAMAKEQADGN